MSRDAIVWVDPGRQGGVPCVMGSRIPTATAARYVWSCGVAEALTAYPHLTRKQVLGACWFEGVYGRKRNRKRFGSWAADVHGNLWRDDYDVPDPPSEPPLTPPQPPADHGDGSGAGGRSGGEGAL